jgi:hypothetical protein
MHIIFQSSFIGKPMNNEPNTAVVTAASKKAPAALAEFSVYSIKAI